MTRNRRRIVAAALAVVLLAAGYAVFRWWWERPPYGPEALGLTAVVEILPSIEPSFGSPGTPSEGLAPGPSGEYRGFTYYPLPGSTVVGGRVTWNPMPGSSEDWDKDGWFAIFVVDKRVDLMPPSVRGFAAPGHTISSGSDGVQSQVAEKYPWLRGADYIKIDDHDWRSPGDSLSVSPATGDVTFVAEFPQIPSGDPERRLLASGPIALSDIMVALVYIGPGRQVYWAKRLFG